MRDQAAHFKKMFWHKFYVFGACWRLGVPLCRALLHDWTKYTPAEWRGYVKHFYNPDGSTRSIRRADGSYDPSAQPADFQSAWLHHQRNKHHWQAWCVIGDNGKLEPLPIPVTFLLEMVADWVGAGKAYEADSGWSFFSTVTWYKRNENAMILHEVTRKKLAAIIALVYERSQSGQQFDLLKRRDMIQVFREV